ncbi:MAG: Ig-like domain-containing protein [Alphaproteobacteria bacterium]|nr:Ig-like domain-containing protein [Alphaproteobacteria bacterium]
MRRHATIGLGLLLTACTGGKAAEEDDLDEVLGILLTPTEVVVPVGQTAQLSATGLLDGRESLDLTRSVDWRSSDPGVLAISNDLDEEGVATGISAGVVRVTARYGDVDAVPLDVVVTDADVERLGVYPDSLALVEGESLQMTATAFFSDGSESDASGQVRWITDDGTVATITAQGRLTAEGVGSTVVHAEWAGVETPDVPVTVSAGGGGSGGGATQADLRIKSASGSVSGGYLDLTVTVENTGDASAGDFWVDVFVDQGTPSVGDLGDDFQLVTWVAAESTTTLTFEVYVGDSASHQVAVMADTNDDIDERDESDNVFSTTVGGSGGGDTGGGGGGSGPDLEISYFDYIYDVHEGSVYYYVDITNAGDVAVGDSFYVDLFLDRDDAPSLYEDGDDWTSLSGLGAGETTYADFLIDDVWCHWCWSWVMVDGYDVVDETDESDNVDGPLDVY